MRRVLGNLCLLFMTTELCTLILLFAVEPLRPAAVVDLLIERQFDQVDDVSEAAFDPRRLHVRLFQGHASPHGNRVIAAEVARRIQELWPDLALTK